MILLAVFVISTCGLVYELVSGATATYLLGESVFQFSTIIGVYLFFMGVGSYLSRYLTKELTRTFIQVQLAAGWIGGFSSALFFLFSDQLASIELFVYFVLSIVGLLVGVGIPLLMRILREQFDLKDLVSRVFAIDYLGALVASVLFPLILLPHLGLIRSSFFFGIVNAATSLALLALFRTNVPNPKPLAIVGAAITASLVAGFAYSNRIMTFSESVAAKEKIVFAKTTPYQRIVFTRGPFETRLLLNGYIQFSTFDEYRYHEALIHPGLAAVDHPRNVLILGGGDGLAAREILKYDSIEKITLVDLDPEMTRLFSTHPDLVKLNHGSLKSPKLQVTNEDGFSWLKAKADSLPPGSDGIYDFITVDFPDPTNFGIGKLYTSSFYSYLYRVLKKNGVISIQDTSPVTTRHTYWMIVNTLKSVGFRTTPYHVHVPSFVEQGYVIASKGEYRPPAKYLDGLKFIDPETVRSMLNFPKDIGPVPTEINDLNNQLLVYYYMRETAPFRR